MELSGFLVRIQEAVDSGRVRATDYAREGAAVLGWNEWDIALQLRDLRAADWLRCEWSRDPLQPALIWVFAPDFWDGGGLWVRLIERSGILVVSFHKG
jgi:hypothetical protein